MSPIRGPLVTTSPWIDMIRPRSASGVSSWTSVERNTAEKTSAVPARARQIQASGKANVSRPKAVIARPQPTTASTIARPIRRTDVTQPDSSAPRNEPTAGAAASSPNPAGPVLNTSSARTGKSEVGIPKIIALRSITKLPRIARRCRANRSPSAIAASPGRAASSSGGSGRMATRAVSEAANVATSTAYAPATPTVAISSPPTAGPTIEAVWKLSWLSAMAAGRRSAGTSRAIDDERVGWSTAPRPAARNATANRAGSGGFPLSASTVSVRLQTASPDWVSISSRRRSTASASDPAPSANSRMGTSWKSVSAPIASVDPVRT